ncbi:hypothetical protein KGF54_000590 [Candida jiufengensis]|uniref:uncharacterized protein n=1 Tax=Candida jiufengensis TaxID=497108 RepID=UPI0022247C9B|nr:uncharacterized protein KGF54_000590 [Candida jiufengensis]KAI5956971.1 hypothetical protein KGF54_000590 [Candida jiufengensis]
MSSLEDEVNNTWHELYDNFVEKNNLKKDKEVLKQRKAQQQPSIEDQNDTVDIDLSSDLPNLSKLIESQTIEDQEKLSNELKNAIIKFYWAGFQLRKDIEKSVT